MNIAEYKKRDLITCAMLVFVTLFLFWPIGEHEFIYYDDGKYIVQNPMINHGFSTQGIIDAFTKGHFFMWHPLTSLSHMLDCELFGLKPGPHHLENAFIHSLSAALLFLFLRRATGTFWQSFIVAALFAWHPLRVESVAWASERKDVLCTLFWLLTFHAYVSYVRRPARSSYAILIFIYAIGTMTKPMIVTLPFVLLLLDLWPFSRINLDSLEPVSSASLQQWARSWLPLIKEKLPLFILSIALSAISFVMQHSGNVVVGTQRLPVSGRIENAAISYVRYLGKLVWPQDLIIFYPHPLSWPIWEFLTAVLILVVISVLIWRLRARRPWMLVGWLWFLGTLVPVIGLLQVGAQSMADRYTYIPTLGLLIAAVWETSECSKAWPERRIILGGVAAFACVASLLLTREQLAHWRNNFTLFEYTLSVGPNNYMAHVNLGSALAAQGKIDEAMKHYDAALKIKPDNAKLHYELGVALEGVGRQSAALEHYVAAVQIDSEYAEAHYRLALLLGRMGKMQEAVPHLDKALRLKPELEKKPPAGKPPKSAP